MAVRVPRVEVDVLDAADPHAGAGERAIECFAGFAAGFLRPTGSFGELVDPGRERF